jgi:hypothetical protein
MDGAETQKKKFGSCYAHVGCVTNTKRHSSVYDKTQDLCQAIGQSGTKEADRTFVPSAIRTHDPPSA